MCIAMPRKVISIEKNKIITELNGVNRSADASLVKDLKINDYVIVANSIIVEKLGDEQALEMINMLEL